MLRSFSSYNMLYMMSFSIPSLSSIVAYSGLRYAPSWRSNIWSTAWNRCSMFECRRSRPCRYQKLIHVPTVCMPQTSFEWSWLKCFCSSTGINFQTLRQNSALAPTAHHFPKILKSQDYVAVGPISNIFICLYLYKYQISLNICCGPSSGVHDTSWIMTYHDHLEA